jgi:hypothetical protein
MRIPFRNGLCLFALLAGLGMQVQAADHGATSAQPAGRHEIYRPTLARQIPISKSLLTARELAC